MKVSLLTFYFFVRCFYLFHMNIFIENLLHDASSHSSRINSLNSSESDVIFSFVKISHMRASLLIENFTNFKFLIRSDFELIVVSLSFNEIEILLESCVFVSHSSCSHSKTFIFFLIEICFVFHDQFNDELTFLSSSRFAHFLRSCRRRLKINEFNIMSSTSRILSRFNVTFSSLSSRCDYQFLNINRDFSRLSDSDVLLFFIQNQ